MVETQLDRIENMCKAILLAATTIEMKGTDQDRKELRAHIEANYNAKKEVSP